MLGCRFLLAIVVGSSLVAVGCGGSQDAESGSQAIEASSQGGHGHDHADPKNLTEAVEVLAEIRDELATAFKAGDVKAVDEAWHEIYPVAKATKTLVADAGLDRYDLDAANSAADQIEEVLKQLHPPHGADAKVDPADYEAQADSLNDAITNLKSLAEKSAAAPAE